MKTIATTYSDQQLRILVEEFIAMQRSTFTFKGVCSYILYRAMEEEKTACSKIYESNQLQAEDCAKIRSILEKITKEGRIAVTDVMQADNAQFNIVYR